MLCKMNRARARLLAGAKAAAFLIAFTGAVASSALAQEREIGKVGSFTILKINENGKFNRCAASKNAGANMLRIAFSADRQHYMSVPGVEGSGLSPMRIRFDAKPPITIVPNSANKNRASVELDYPTVDRFMGAKRLEVSFAGQIYTWDLSGQSMEAVLRAVSNCTGKAVSG